MMIALLSPTLGGVAPRPNWLPTGAIAFLDFVNGHYYAGGQVRSVGDILGAGFDASQIFAGGMLVAYENSNRPKAIGALHSDLASGLASGCTAVVEARHNNDPSGPYVMWLDAASQDFASNNVDFGAGSGKAYVEDFNELFFLAAGLASTGIHTITATLNRNAGGGNREYAVAVDGGAFVTQDVAYDPFAPVVTILIGHDGDGTYVLDNTLVRAITLYPPQSTPLVAGGTPVADAMVGLAYSAQFGATGGTLPYSFSVHAGSLPAGLNLNSSTGEISGTPTGTGVSSGIVVRVTDANGATSDLASFTITVRNTLIRLVDQKSHDGTASFTLSGVNFGPAHSSRVLAVAATTAGGAPTGMVIAGTTASAGASASGTRSAAIFFAATPAGTSGDIDVTMPGINIFGQFDVFALYGVAASAFGSDTLVVAPESGTTSFGASVGTDAGGIVLAALCTNDRTVTVDWTGLAEITDFYPGSSILRSSEAGLMDSTTGTLSITADTSGICGASLAAVSFPSA